MSRHPFRQRVHRHSKSAMYYLFILYSLDWIVNNILDYSTIPQSSAYYLLILYSLDWIVNNILDYSTIPQSSARRSV